MNTKYSMLRLPTVYFDADSSGNGGGNNDQQPEKPTGKVYTQEQLNEMFADRAKQARGSALADLFKELGVESSDNLKAIITKAKEADDAQKTELQKAQDDLERAKKLADENKANYESELEKLSKRVQDTEIKVAAGNEVKDKDGKVTRPKFRPDAYDVVLSTINRKGITDKDGVYTGIEEALDELAKAKPFLLETVSEATPKGSPKGQQPRKPEKSSQTNASSGKHSRF